MTVAEALAALRRRHPRHEIWTVPRALGRGPTWHARRQGDDIFSVIHADTPEDLSAAIARAETARQ